MMSLLTHFYSDLNAFVCVWYEEFYRLYAMENINKKIIGSLQQSSEDLLQITNWILLTFIKCNLLYQVDLPRTLHPTVWIKQAFLALP